MKHLIHSALALAAALILSNCRTTNNYTIIEPLAPKPTPPKVTHHVIVDESPSNFRATSPNATTTEKYSNKYATSPDTNKPGKNDSGSFQATKN